LSALIFSVLLLLGLQTCATSPYRDLSLVDLLELYRAELDMPGLDVASAAVNLPTPDAAFAFVRDGVMFSPYIGRVQTPDEVLNTRVANGADKAALLAQLLGEIGWQVRFESVEGGQILPVVQKPASAPSKILIEISQRIDYDIATLEGEWANLSQQTAIARSQVGDLVAQANDLLISLESGFGPYDSFGVSSDPLGERIITIASLEDEIRYFDPVYIDTDLPLDGTALELGEISDVVVELRLADGTGLEQNLLRFSGALMGRDVSLGFIPAIDTIERLAGPSDLSDITMWQPVLSINGQSEIGKPFTLGGGAPGLALSPPIFDVDAFELADPASAVDLQIARISTDNWPQVSLSLQVDSNGEGIWVPAQFLVRDNASTVQPRLLNLKQVAQPILILSDVSFSMEDIGAFEISKTAIAELAQYLSEQTPVGLTAFAGGQENLLGVVPLGDGKDLIKAANSLSPNSFTGIYAALAHASRQENLDDGVVILLSDGYDNVGGNEEEIVAALQARNIRVFALALGSDVDVSLLRRIGEATNGEFVRIRSAAELTTFYARLGRELSSFVTLEYDVQTDGVRTAEAQIDLERDVQVSLIGTDFVDNGVYIEPPLGSPGEPPRLILNIEMPVGAEVRRSERVLIDLSDKNAPLALTGAYSIIGDLGGYPVRRVASAYISDWIDALKFAENGDLPLVDPFGPSLDQMLMVNAFRSLSTFGDEVQTRPGAGPNLYLRRNVIRRVGEDIERFAIFDVMMRAYRSTGGLKTSDIRDMEIASAIAEGMVLGGNNGVEALLANPQSITLTRGQEPLPDWLSPALRQEMALYTLRNVAFLASADAPQWVWQVSGGLRSIYIFRAFYGEGLTIAKGATAEEIASVFDKIDKMYQIYDSVLGNYGGLNPIQGGLLSAAASMKREENKLWCYSSVMMGYVADSIDSQESALDIDPVGAKANAARLCKIDGDPGDGEAFVNRAAKRAVEDGLNSFATNVIKVAEGGLGAAAHSVLTTGGAIFNVAVSYNVSSAQPLPVTPGFHRAMGQAFSNAAGIGN